MVEIGIGIFALIVAISWVVTHRNKLNKEGIKEMYEEKKPEIKKAKKMFWYQLLGILILFAIVLLFLVIFNP
ncbi:MAG: hypothetical protein LBS83_00405 [Holosporales bacterium]|jgi:uncharacterized BrkB/YihY/UPF0761 family membrane protein|nr:hypothetical protein [Holosporales bacterium]